MPFQPGVARCQGTDRGWGFTCNRSRFEGFGLSGLGEGITAGRGMSAECYGRAGFSAGNRTGNCAKRRVGGGNHALTGPPRIASGRLQSTPQSPRSLLRHGTQQHLTALKGPISPWNEASSTSLRALIGARTRNAGGGCFRHRRFQATPSRPQPDDARLVPQASAGAALTTPSM